MPRSCSTSGRPTPESSSSLRRVDRAGGEQHLAIGARLVLPPVSEEAHARHAAAFEYEALRHRIGYQAQVGPLQCRPQEALGGVPAEAALLVDLEEAGALVVAVVEVGARHDAELLGALLHGAQDVPGQALLCHLPLAAAAVEIGLAAMMVFRPQEIGQHVVPAPADIAHLAPAVVVGGLAAHVDHAVDRGAAAQHLAARIDQRAAVEARLRRRLHHPVGARIADAVEIADRDMHPVIVVRAAGLEQQDARARDSASGGWPARSRPCRRRR